MKPLSWLPHLICVFAIFICQAHGEPKATIEPWFDGKKPLTPNTTWCEFPDDALTLVLADGNKQLGQENFCSSYGRARAAVVTDKRGRRYVMLEYNEGRGPNATVEYLRILRVANDIYELARVPLAWATGPTQRFSYRYQVRSADDAGIKIELDGAASGGDECCVPAERKMIISIEPNG